MIFMFKDQCYCLTDWLTAPSGLLISRRVIHTTGYALDNQYIGFKIDSYYYSRSYILCAEGILKEPYDLYVRYNRRALKPVYEYDFTLTTVKDQVDDFLLRIDKLRAFI